MLSPRPAWRAPREAQQLAWRGHLGATVQLTVARQLGSEHSYCVIHKTLCTIGQRVQSQTFRKPTSVSSSLSASPLPPNQLGLADASIGK